ncbi:GLPGLI family protein [Polaribacter gochangensis]|uniref:GLPGLI family protein n=1 Tax=Polaribacter gochangensis TaxID=3252903 RepID=UPI003904B833
MINKTIILVLTLITQLIYSQEKATIIANYTYINKGLNEVSIAKLYIKGSESLTVFYKIDSLSNKNNFDDEESFNINIDGNDKIGKQVYKNLNERKIIFRDVYSKEGKLRPCIVEEKTPNFVWGFGHGVEVKKIGKYVCNLAKLKFRGREYEVWFTTKIPIIHGPWKFYGLPGLIIEMKSIDGNIHFLLNSIKESNNILDYSIVKPNNGDKILFKDYITYKNEAVNDFIKKLQSTLPRGAKIKVNSNEDYNIEKVFEEKN